MSGFDINFGTFKLGKKGENFDFSKIKSGIVENGKNKVIFEKFDSNNNGVLEKSEIDNLKKSLAPFIEDGVVSKREARKILKEQGLDDVKAKEFFEFLQNAGASSEDIQDCFYSLFGDKQAVCIKYKKDENGFVKTSSRDVESGKLMQETFENGIETRTVTYADDGETVTSEKIVQGAKTTLKDSQGRITKVTIDKGSGISEVTEYEYEGNSTAPIKVTTKKMSGGKEIQEPETPPAEEHDENKTVFENGRTLTKTEDGAILQDKDGKQVSVKYDKDGNLLSSAKAGESFAQTAERLGIQKGTPEYEKFKELNAKAAKNGWFVVGSEVKIPAGMEDRVNLDGLNVDAKSEVSKFGQKAVQDADISKYNADNTEKKVLDKNTTWWDLAKGTLAAEGRENPTNAEISTRMNELMKLNEGKQPTKGAELTLPKAPEPEAPETVAPELEPPAQTEEPAAENPVPPVSGQGEEPADTTGTQPLDIKINLDPDKLQNMLNLAREGDAVANDLHDDIHQWGTGEKFDEHINDINSGNVVDVLKSYDAKSPGETLIEAIFDELGMSSEKQIASVKHIKDALVARCNNLGVDASILTQEFDKAFEDATTGALASIGYVDTDKLDSLVNEFVNRIDTMEKMDKAARERYLQEEGYTKIPDDLKADLSNDVKEITGNGDDAFGNGKIDSPAMQMDGNCWAHAGLNAIAATPAGKEILNNLVTKRAGVIAVRLPEAAQKGLPKPNGDGIYTFTEFDVANGTTTQSMGDGDVTAVMLAINKYFEETGENDGSENRTVGGTATRMFEIISGQKAKSYAVMGNKMLIDGGSVEKVRIPEGVSHMMYSDMPLENTHYSALQNMLNNSEGALYITFKESVVPEGDTNSAALDRDYNEDNSNSPYISRHHAYAVTKMDDEFVYLVESNNPNAVIKMPKDEFMEKVYQVATYKF